MTGVVYAEEALSRRVIQMKTCRKKLKNSEGRRPDLARPGEKTGQIN